MFMICCTWFRYEFALIISLAYYSFQNYCYRVISDPLGLSVSLESGGESMNTLALSLLGEGFSLYRGA